MNTRMLTGITEFCNWTGYWKSLLISCRVLCGTAGTAEETSTDSVV